MTHPQAPRTSEQAAGAIDLDALLDHKPHADAEPEFEEHGRKRTLGGFPARLLMAFALLFSTFQLVIAADLVALSSLPVRSIHIGFLSLLTFILYPAFKKSSLGSVAWYDWLLGLGGFAIGFYHLVFEAEIIQHSGEPTDVEIVLGTTMIVLVFEGTRRVMGLALPIVCGLFLAYGLFGQYLPGDLAHRGYDFSAIVNQLYLGTDGIYGTPTLVSATYIFLFILFGSFLEHAGMIRLFNAIALGFVGHAKGGPAKVAVLSSGFMGMISGSGVANVLTVGQFTIPLMKRFMAETLNLPYADIVKAAIIPALLYYFTAFTMVHLEAGRGKLLGLPKAQCPNPWKHMRENWYLMVPLAILVFMLFHGFTPKFAGMMGLCMTALLILGAALAARIHPTVFRYVLWFGIGLGAATFLKWGIQPVLAVIALLVIACLFIQGGKKTLRSLRDGLTDGAKQAVPVGLACGIVGVIIGVLSLTGAATNFAGVVLKVGDTSVFLSLLLTMLVCLVLGMGIPTIPNYIITSAIAAPALLKLGVPLLVSHMFVFYFGIMADLTPPVALAAFAAASIAKASPMKIGFKATQIAIAGFVIPFMAVYDNALMLQGDWTYSAVAYVVFKCLLSIVLWGGVVVGHLYGDLTKTQRVGCGLTAAMLVSAMPLTDEIGFGMAAAMAVWMLITGRRLAAASNSVTG